MTGVLENSKLSSILNLLIDFLSRSLDFYDLRKLGVVSHFLFWQKIAKMNSFLDFQVAEPRDWQEIAFWISKANYELITLIRFHQDEQAKIWIVIYARENDEKWRNFHTKIVRP